MKRKFWNWWYFTVKNTTRKKLTIGGFNFKFRDYDVTITSISDNFKLRVRAGEFMFGYLCSALGKGDKSQLHGYAAIMYMLATGIAKDAKLAREVNGSCERYMTRMQAFAEKEAEKVEGDGKEEIEMMKDDVAVAKMSRRKRRAHKREVEKIVRKELNNQNRIKEDGDEKHEGNN